MTNPLINTITAAVREAGDVMVKRYADAVPPPTFADLVAAVRANDAAVGEVLRPALTAALPDAAWEADEHATGPAGAGDLWVTDPVGGNVNAVHGLPEWNIGVTLVRGGLPYASVVFVPLTGEMFTAVAGEGAYLDGLPLRVSAKTELSAALAGTGQALPGREPAAADRAGASISAMMRHALLVRASVPVTHQLLQVAAGRLDLHWQFDNVRSHIGPLLIVREAGGTVTHLDGRPWHVAGGAYLAAAPGLHAAALDVLRTASLDAPLPASFDAPLPASFDAPLPANLGTPLPAEPGTPLPANLGTPLPTDPGTPLPADPGTPLPTDPGTPLPADPGTPLPAELGTSGREG